MEKLLSYGWPGNARELVNVLERAVLLAQHGQIDAAHVVLPEEAETPLIVPYRDAKTRFELEYFVQLMQSSRGNVALAARLARKTRKEVYDALKRLGLDPGSYRSGADAGEDADPAETTAGD